MRTPRHGMFDLRTATERMRETLEAGIPDEYLEASRDLFNVYHAAKQVTLAEPMPERKM